MTAVPLSAISQILERQYTRGIKYIGLGKKTPFWSRIPKYDNFFEETLDMRNRYGLNPSGSRDFANSRSNAGASPFGNFRLTRAYDYLTVQFEGQTLRAARKDAKRMVSYLTEETDSAFGKMARRINHNLYRNAGGALGRIVSGGNTQTITVYDRAALIGVFPGMRLVTSNTDGTSGSVDANPTNVASVDREAGTITTDAAVSWANAAGGFSDDDYFFAQGDFGLAMTGADAWIPASAPGATLFFSQNRALDPVYLGGVRYVAQSGDPDGTIARALQNAAAEGSIHGAEPSECFMHPLDFVKFSLEVQGSVTTVNLKGRLGAYDDDENTVDVGISAIRIMLPTGPCDVMPDPDCQRNVAWMIDMRTWGWYGLGMTGPEFLTHDGGNKMLRMSADNVDGVEGHIGYYAQIGCSAPGCNIRVDLTNVL